MVDEEKSIRYRKLAFESYDPVCAHCGFGIPAVLEVAHIDGDRCNNEVANLVILCPNCHKMFDLDLISTATIIEMRDRPKSVCWSKRMKDAGKKAAETRKWRRAGRKAAETRKQRQAARLSNSAESASPDPGDVLKPPNEEDSWREVAARETSPEAPIEDATGRQEFVGLKRGGYGD